MQRRPLQASHDGCHQGEPRAGLDAQRQPRGLLRRARTRLLPRRRPRRGLRLAARRRLQDDARAEGACRRRAPRHLPVGDHHQRRVPGAPHPPASRQLVPPPLPHFGLCPRDCSGSLLRCWRCHTQGSARGDAVQAHLDGAAAPALRAVAAVLQQDTSAIVTLAGAPALLCSPLVPGPPHVPVVSVCALQTPASTGRSSWTASGTPRTARDTRGASCSR